MKPKRRPGEVRDAIFAVLSERPEGATTSQIERGVQHLLGRSAPSSVRSYLRLNTDSLFVRSTRGHYSLLENVPPAHSVDPPNDVRDFPSFSVGNTRVYNADCLEWLRTHPQNSVHAVVTDPPYGLFEYTPEQQEKLRNGHGGVWRIPPSFDGAKRSPLPRFTVLSDNDLRNLERFFFEWG
ncbi:MAG TPA: site-specific DNA-methyltransferase, partial [Nitrospiria bacterium]|nr:site-specific DNA-methyltransferase [Nitrospiria bacterium]